MLCYLVYKPAHLSFIQSLFSTFTSFPCSIVLFTPLGCPYSSSLREYPRLVTLHMHTRIDLKRFYIIHMPSMSERFVINLSLAAVKLMEHNMRNPAPSPNRKMAAHKQSFSIIVNSDHTHFCKINHQQFSTEKNFCRESCS